MKVSLYSMIAGCGLALFTGLGQAQTLTDTVTIEGELTQLENSFQGPAQLAPGSRFVVTIEQDRTATESSATATMKFYEDAVLQMEVMFYDDQGVPISTPVVTTYSSTTMPSIDSRTAQFLFDPQVAEEATYAMQGMDINGRNMDTTINLSETTQTLLTDTSNYPAIAEGAVDALFSFYVMNGDEGRGISMSAEGNVDTISVVFVDTDNDGVPDYLDQCAASLESETVMFDWVDSGVTNYTDASGCTIMDRYAACEPDETQQPSSPWGWFQPVYSGPGYCESQVVYQLQDEGIIDYSEGRMLRNALRLSHDSSTF
ncbi:hypothetical protein J6I90_05930 [Pseudidiomarina sp. 1APP75-32.1]|uniref:Uncharacterized protein n=1 Tax=Pseudidiomarina terrestris TaxID=2820060 RepID=A0AAW7QZX5_9GAMM|nr:MULTISPECIES: hypothetical protein [unclassified Pseudidiomarina]MDN7124413.1 hypothetical protein [Pseudidiomarina sp. 1APP75-32.1]MDN7129296.1 hypothetical protein [Pseudidiomarina sp. 1APR75-15]